MQKIYKAVFILVCMTALALFVLLLDLGRFAYDLPKHASINEQIEYMGDPNSHIPKFSFQDIIMYSTNIAVVEILEDDATTGKDNFNFVPVENIKGTMPQKTAKARAVYGYDMKVGGKYLLLARYDQERGEYILTEESALYRVDSVIVKSYCKLGAEKLPYFLTTRSMFYDYIRKNGAEVQGMEDDIFTGGADVEEGKRFSEERAEIIAQAEVVSAEKIEFGFGEIKYATVFKLSESTRGEIKDDMFFDFTEVPQGKSVYDYQWTLCLRTARNGAYIGSVWKSEK